MNSITILGSGRVGTTLANALAEAGHDVTLGARNPQQVQSTWAGSEVTVLEVPAAILRSEIVINATPGDTSLQRLGVLQSELAGKILVDVANASTRNAQGLPAGLLYGESSLGERLQTALPSTRVVKTLNTMLFSAMTVPRSLGSTPSVFVSGDDAEAKATVRGLLTDLGWDTDWILDLGGINTAQGTEAFALVVPSLLKALGFAPFALSVAR